LRLSPENKLVVAAASTQYELELSDLKYSCSTQVSVHRECLGLFSLQQPLNNAFGLTMSLGQMPGQQWSGTWLVANQDASQLCAGSIDLLPSK
jgi:hypothetical protein